MIIKGRIYLYYRDGSLIKSKYYRSKGERKEIINDWMVQYGKNYNQTYTHILPYFDDERVMLNGETPPKYKQTKTLKNKEELLT